MNGVADDKDAHLLNAADEYGGLPEYKPYSFINQNIIVDQTWSLSEVNGSSQDSAEITSRVLPIDTRQEFEQTYSAKLKSEARQ